MENGNKSIDGFMDKKLGDKESSSLLPEAIVEIVDTRVDAVGDKKTPKLICVCKHPERDDNIEISSLKFEKAGVLAVSGLWINEDEDGNIKKNSGLGQLMSFLKISTLSQLKGCKIQSVLDERGYLTLKAY